jgi:hypothetical protein
MIWDVLLFILQIQDKMFFTLCLITFISTNDVLQMDNSSFT